MDPGWPYAYNRLVAATSGQTAGNFAHITATTGTPAATATPLIVQPTATVPTSPYGTTSFLAPPAVGYDVFSTLFHPHAAAAAQVNSQAANLKVLNYGTVTPAQQEASNSPTTVSSSSTLPASQQTHQTQQSTQQQTQYNYQNSTLSRPATNLSWNSSNVSAPTGQQQLQFGLIPNSGTAQSSSSSVDTSLASITRVNSNGCSATSATTSSIYGNYNAQLKAHPLYQLNSHLANAAVMAMANKLSANRTALSVPLTHSPGTPNQNVSCSGTVPNVSANYSASNDRTKHQLQHTQQEYVHQPAKPNNANPSPTPAVSLSSSSNSSAAIPLIQFEATRIQQQLQLQLQQSKAPEQSSPISYSMWSNNSPVQNKFNNCDVGTQQQEQQPQTIQQQIVRRPPMHSPNPVQSAFTRQAQPNAQQDIYNNQRPKGSSSADYNSSNSNHSNHSGDNQTNRSSSAVVVPRRPSPMQMGQTNLLGNNLPSPAYPMYNSPMNMNQPHQQQSQFASNNNSRDTSSVESTYQATPLSKNVDASRGGNSDSSGSYSSVITRVAGSTWDQKSDQQGHNGGPSEPLDNRLEKVPKRRRAQGQEEHSGGWQQQQQPSGTGNHQINSNGSGFPVSSSVSRSALQQQPTQTQASGFGPWRGEEDAEAAERRRAELARSLVVVPDIMEELNFLTADGIKAENMNKKTNSGIPTKPTNGRVQIISVEATEKKPPSNSIEKPSMVVATAKKPEDNGFIGSYLKFLQGDTNTLGVTSVQAPKQRKIAAGLSAASKRKHVASQQKPSQSSDQQQDATNAKGVDYAKRSKAQEEDQGYVPNGGTGAFESSYPPQPPPYQQQYMHPISISQAHYQGPVAGNSGIAPMTPVPTTQMLSHQPYTPNSEADGFNYFDLPFRSRW